MGRPTTKEDAIAASEANYEKLVSLIESLTEKELSTPFDFSNDPKKKEAYWGRDKNVRDVVVHLHEWHKLILSWVSSNTSGNEAPFLPKPYNWKTYGDMNVAFWGKHQNTSQEDAMQLFALSHGNVMKLLSKFSGEELFSKGAFPWVGGSTLGSYFVSATSSHYEWALKIIKAHRKNCGIS